MQLELFSSVDISHPVCEGLDQRVGPMVRTLFGLDIDYLIARKKTYNKVSYAYGTRATPPPLVKELSLASHRTFTSWLILCRDRPRMCLVCCHPCVCCSGFD